MNILMSCPASHFFLGSIYFFVFHCILTKNRSKLFFKAFEIDPSFICGYGIITALIKRNNRANANNKKLYGCKYLKVIFYIFYMRVQI
jgi:hypothetical protein